MRLSPLPFAACVGAALIAGCATVRVEPIHITVDINIKVDRALDEFFAAPKAPATPVVAPGSTPVPSK